MKPRQHTLFTGTPRSPFPNTLCRWLATMPLLAVVLMLLPSAAAAQSDEPEQDALYIYRNDGCFNAFFYADIDRIEYSRVDTSGVERDEYVTQEVYALDTVFRIPISAIDSVGFVTPKTRYRSDVAATDASELWSYVVSSDSATWFVLDGAPAYLVPRIGDKIVTTRSRDYLPHGFYGRVTGIVPQGSMVLVQCEIPPLTELFEEWVCKTGRKGTAHIETTVNTDRHGKKLAAPRRLSEQSMIDDAFPLDPDEFYIDLTDWGWQFTPEVAGMGTAQLKFGTQPVVYLRAFAMTRLELALNVDVNMRVEKTHYFDLKVSGSISGQKDIPCSKKYIWIQDTPFSLEIEAGFSFSLGCENNFEFHKKYVESIYGAMQYNQSFYDYNPIPEETGWVHASHHDVLQEESKTFKGTVSATFGPYAGIWLGLMKREIGSVGLRVDAGLKLSASLDLQFKDYLFSAFPALLPAYMLTSPTALYDALNRDASVSAGLFATGKIEGNIGRWKKEAKLMDLDAKLAKWEGGIVPKFSQLDLYFDEDTDIPNASVFIGRRTLWRQPVGFAAYYTKSGKRLGSVWYSHEYDGNPNDLNFASQDYKLELPKFGGGKAVRVFPTVRLKPFNAEILASPYGDYTIPAKCEAKPEELEIDSKAQPCVVTFTDNLDRNEDTYEREVKVRYVRDDDDPEEEWIDAGYWDGNDYHFHVAANTTSSLRMCFIAVTTKNANSSVVTYAETMVTQNADDTANDVSVEPTELEYEAAGGTQRVKVNWGEYNRYGATVRSEGASWVTVAAADGYISITTKPNTSSEPRQCYVDCRVYMAGAPESEWVKMPVLVKQKGATVEPDPDPVEPGNADFKSIVFWTTAYTKASGVTSDALTEVDLTFNFRPEYSTYKVTQNGNITHIECRGREQKGTAIVTDNSATLSFDIDNSTRTVKNLAFSFEGQQQQKYTIWGETANTTTTTHGQLTLGDFPFQTFASTYKEAKYTLAQGLAFNSWSVTQETNATYSDPDMEPYYEQMTFNYTPDQRNYAWLIINYAKKEPEQQNGWPDEAVMNSLKNAGMPIHTGDTPPTVSGTYSLSPLALVANGMGDGGDISGYDALIMNFSGQQDNKLKYNFYLVYEGQHSQTIGENTAVISGDGTAFSMSIPDGDMATIISGELHDGQITNLYYASTSMTDPSEHIIIKDADSNSPATFWAPGSFGVRSALPRRGLMRNASPWETDANVK